MNRKDEIPLEVVEDLVERSIVTLARQGDRERSFLGAPSKAWGQDWLDGAEAIRKVVAEGKADWSFLQLTGADFDDFHFFPDEETQRRVRMRNVEPVRDDQLLEALGWVAALGRKPSKRARRRRRAGDQGDTPQDFEVRLVWWVALGFSFEIIGKRMKINARKARARYSETMFDVWRIANGYLVVPSQSRQLENQVVNKLKVRRSKYAVPGSLAKQA